MIDHDDTVCEECDGSGQDNGFSCGYCGGTGVDLDAHEDEDWVWNSDR